MISRRQFVGGGISLAAIAATSSQAAPFQAVDGLEALSPLQIFTRIRCSPPGSVTTWWYSGHMLGRVSDQPASVLMSIQGASQSRITLRDDGSVLYDLIEAGYYGDPASGEVVDGEMNNVLTGQPMTPQHYLSSQSIQFFPDLTVKPSRALPPSISYRGRITPPDVKQGKVWMAEELFVRIAGREGGKPRIANSLANFQAEVQDVLTGGDFVPATFEYTTWNSFRPWMNMEQRNGSIMMRLNSAKLSSWTQLPAKLKDRIDSDHPDSFSL